MVTKAIIEEIISPYQVKIRIPKFNQAAHSTLKTPTENLNTATICSLPNCYLNLQVGDVVFVAFEDNAYNKAVIIGHLCREAASSTYCDISVNNIVVQGACALPNETHIGDLTSVELMRLHGVRENLQEQIDSLSSQIALIYEKLGGTS